MYVQDDDKLDPVNGIDMNPQDGIATDDRLEYAHQQEIAEHQDTSVLDTHNDIMDGAV